MTSIQDIKEIGKAWMFTNIKNCGEDLKIEIHGLNIEHSRVCLQNL